MISKKTMLHIHSKDRSYGTVENFDVSLSDNPRMHGIKALSLESVEMVNSVYNIPKTWSFACAIVKRPNDVAGQIEPTLISNTKNTLHLLYILSNGNEINFSVQIGGNMNYTASLFTSGVQQSINNYFITNNINDSVTFGFSHASTFTWSIGTTGATRIFIKKVSGSLTDYFITSFNPTTFSSFQFPKSNVYWNDLYTSLDKWFKIRDEYPNGVIYYSSSDDPERSLAPGNYNAAQLEVALNTIFSSYSVSYNRPVGTLSLSLNPSSFKSEIQLNSLQPDQYRIYIDQTRGAKELGFKQLYYTVPPISWKIVGDSLVNINSHDIVYLHCPTFPSVSVTTHNGGQVNSTIAKIPLGSVPMGTTYYYKNASDTLMTFENLYSDITSLNFYLTDENNETIDMNGIDYSMTFIIYT